MFVVFEFVLIHDVYEELTGRVAKSLEICIPGVGTLILGYSREVPQ